MTAKFSFFILYTFGRTVYVMLNKLIFASVASKRKFPEIKKIPKESGLESEPTTGLEPVTSSLPRKHSTAELSRPKPKNHTRKA